MSHLVLPTGPKIYRPPFSREVDYVSGGGGGWQVSGDYADADVLRFHDGAFEFDLSADGVRKDVIVYQQTHLPPLRSCGVLTIEAGIELSNLDNVANTAISVHLADHGPGEVRNDKLTVGLRQHDGVRKVCVFGYHHGDSFGGDLYSGGIGGWNNPGRILFRVASDDIYAHFVEGGNYDHPSTNNPSEWFDGGRRPFLWFEVDARTGVPEGRVSGKITDVSIQVA